MRRLINYEHTHYSTRDGSPAMMVARTDETITLVNEDGFQWTDPLDQWESIIGPVACVEIAVRNAGIELGPAQIGLLAQALVDMGANFDA